MAHDISIKQEAIKLRKSGYSIKEIAKKLQIAQSTSSVWLRDIKIPTSGENRMIKHKELNRYKMQKTWVARRQKQRQIDLDLAYKSLENINLHNKNLTKLICAILFWAEGNKNFSHVRFTNSDPKMISTFIGYLRQSYLLDEAKFRACIHLHEYHNPKEIHEYWSKITQIPLNKFRKFYLKPHTGIRKKDNYKGCITIYYFDSSIAHELEALYNALASR